MPTENSLAIGNRYMGTIIIFSDDDLINYV